MAARMRVCGTSLKPLPSLSSAAGGRTSASSSGVASRLGAKVWVRSTSMSRRTMRPLGPVPETPPRSRSASRASRRTSGVAKTRPPRVEVIVVGASPEFGLTGDGGEPFEDGDAPRTPRSRNAASMSSTASPGMPLRAIAAPTSTCSPEPTRNRKMTPASSASMSTMALSVSTVAMASDFLNGTPSCTCHSDSNAVSAPAAMAGIRSRVGMSGLQDFRQLRGDFLGLGDGGAFEHLADARGGLPAGDPFDGMVEPIEIATLDLVGQPTAVGGAARSLFGNHDAVGLFDAGADRVPVHAGAIQPPQVDNVGVDMAGVDGLQAVVDHREIGEDCDVRT